jgi:DNA-directed RNA polymerase specialized sigma24 family protein
VLVNARVVDLLRKERPLDVNTAGTVPEHEMEPPGESGFESESFRRALLATLVEDLRNRIPLRQFEIFERVKLKHQSPALVAEDVGIPRAMIDRTIHKAMTALRELASQPEFQQEFYP